MTNVKLLKLFFEKFKNASITVGQMQELEMASLMKVNGKVDVPPQNMVSISVPLGGYLKTSKLLPGMHVNKGEVVAVMEDQQYIQLQQDFLTAKVKQVMLEKEFARQKELNASQATSDKMLQQAESDYKTQKILVSALSMSIAQRLVRKLCTFCKKEKIPTEEENKIIKLVLDSIKTEGKNLSKYNINPDASFKIFSPVGCEKCNKLGYKGRIGIFEAIKTDEAIEKIIPESPNEHEIKKVARAQGILSMRQDGIVKILNGITSIEEVQSVVDLKEE